MENKISDIIEETISDLGFNLVKVSIHGLGTKIVEILIERQNGERVEVGDCQKISRDIGALLDVEDVISGKYFLEVSSAGLERPLVKLDDFERFVDREIKICLRVAFNGNLKYKGKLLGVDGDKVKLQSKNVELSFPYDNIRKANLVFTDEMFRALLNKKK
ncbi:MAG: ribosome maturation factor RimP [Rickettsiales bacterium]|nr:MAG: ribosome maturation factor RimP [Rickettsiales bacterium]